MFFCVQKGSLTRLNVSAAFFVLSFFLVHSYQIDCLPGEVKEYKLNYDIGFWIFKRIGVGTAILERTDKPDTYRVTLEAHPVGIFTSIVKRQVIYQTVMEYDKKTNKLKPLLSSQKRIKGKNAMDKTIKFDYEKRVCVFEYRKNDVLEKGKTITIPSEANPEDPVTAFHNFCDGTYGEIKEGSTCNIKIIVKEKPSNLSFEMCSKDCKKEFAIQEDNDFGFIAKICLAPEVINSTKGEILVCFSKDSIPLMVKVKDVIGFGDLYGHLVNKVKR